MKIDGFKGFWAIVLLLVLLWLAYQAGSRGMFKR